MVINTKPTFAKLTGQEMLSDFPDLMAIGAATQQAFSGFDPKTATAVSWGTALGIAPVGLAMDALAAYDKLHAAPVTFDVVVNILGLNPAGPLGLTCTFGKKLVAQIQSP